MFCVLFALNFCISRSIFTGICLFSAHFLQGLPSETSQNVIVVNPCKGIVSMVISTAEHDEIRTKAIQTHITTNAIFTKKDHLLLEINMCYCAVDTY